jgi:hypothetical protein
MDTAKPAGMVRLAFGKQTPESLETVATLSAVARAGDSLWLAGDEGQALHRLRIGPGGEWDDHAVFPLAALFPSLPEKTGEADIEGMAVDDGAVWLVGSHSGRRNKPAAGADPREALTLKKRQPNRFLLGRVALDDRGGLAPGSGRTLPFTDGGNALVEALAEDELFRPFANLPSKDNGLDIEGLAVRGDSLFLGLRGPVLRGWALILHCRWSIRDDALHLSRIDGHRRYRIHAFDLDGLGVRDLMTLPDSDDLWILAGPTMALDGPARLYRWVDGLTATAGRCVGGGPSLLRVLELPCGHYDHPEGMAALDDRRLLVVYDSPDPSRLDGAGYRADLFDLP